MKNDVMSIIRQYLDFYPEEKDNLIQLVELVNNNKDYNNLFNRKNFQRHITASGFIYCIS